MNVSDTEDDDNNNNNNNNVPDDNVTEALESIRASLDHSGLLLGEVSTMLTETRGRLNQAKWDLAIREGGFNANSMVNRMLGDCSKCHRMAEVDLEKCTTERQSVELKLLNLNACLEIPNSGSPDGVLFMLTRAMAVHHTALSLVTDINQVKYRLLDISNKLDLYHRLRLGNLGNVDNGNRMDIG